VSLPFDGEIKMYIMLVYRSHKTDRGIKILMLRPHKVVWFNHTQRNAKEIVDLKYSQLFLSHCLQTTPCFGYYLGPFIFSG